MDAWEQLISNSTAPGGSDAWTHLLNQEGYGVGVPFPIQQLAVEHVIISHEVNHKITTHDANFDIIEHNVDYLKDENEVNININTTEVNHSD